MNMTKAKGVGATNFNFVKSMTESSGKAAGTGSQKDAFSPVTPEPSSTPAPDTTNMLQTIRSAVEGGGYIPESYSVPTTEEMMAEAMISDPAGHTFIDGTNEQILLDFKLRFEEMVVEKEAQLVTATPALQNALLAEIEQLKEQIEIVIPNEIEKLRGSTEHFRSMFRQEAELLRQFGRGEITAEEVDINGDGLVDMNGEYFLGERDGEYNIIFEKTGLPVRFDQYGNPLDGNVFNPNYKWDLSQSGLEMISSNSTSDATKHDWVMRPTSLDLQPTRTSHLGSSHKYDVNIDIPLPETMWAKVHADGSLAVKNERLEVYPSDGLVFGEPLEKDKDDYVQVKVTDVRIDSVASSYDANGDAIGYDQVITFESNGLTLGTMKIESYEGDIPEKYQHLRTPGTNRVDASTLSIAFSDGSALNNGDPDLMRSSAINLDVANSFERTSNIGVFRANGNFFAHDLEASPMNLPGMDTDLWDQEYNGILNNSGDLQGYTAETFTKQFFNATPGVDDNLQPYSEFFHGMYMKNHDVGFRKSGVFLMGVPSGSVVQGSKYNDAVTIKSPPEDVTKEDPQYKTVVDTGNGLDAVFAESGDTYAMNVTHFEKQGSKGDHTSVSLEGVIEWKQQEKEDGEGEKYQLQPPTYVKIHTENGTTLVHNELEPPSATAKQSYFTSKEGPGDKDSDKFTGGTSSLYHDDAYDIHTGDLKFSDTFASDISEHHAGAFQVTDFQSDVKSVKKSLLDAIAESYEEEFMDGDLQEAEAWYAINSEYYNQSQAAMNDFFSSYGKAYGMNQFGEEEAPSDDEAVIAAMFEDEKA